MFIPRDIEWRVVESLLENPVTAIIGSRQCGKTTLAKQVVKDFPNSIFLDLERPSDLARLENPELFFQSHKEKLICLDEIQRKPEIFPLIRSMVDEWVGFGHFMILDSASVQLLR